MSQQRIDDVFRLGDMELQSAQILEDARLAYCCQGRLNNARDNLVVLPTHYGGAIRDNFAWLDDTASPLANQDYCVLVPALFGNGESSSPSTMDAGAAPGDFPAVSLLDNIHAQQRLVEERFDGAPIALVAGWSMGGMQALQWAAHAPARVNNVLAICATARCYPHNAVFLEGLKAALEADPDFTHDGARHPRRGLRAFARVYAGWAYSQRFFRDGLYRTLGFETIDALFAGWEATELGRHAHDLIAMLETWRTADIGTTPPYGDRARPDTHAALAAISARTIVMPASTDLYFTAEDAALDAASIANAEWRVLESDYGHCAGGPGREPAAMQQIFAAMRELLDTR